MDTLTTFVHQLEGSIRKLTRSREDNEITQDTFNCLSYLIQAARVLAMEEKKKYPGGYLPPPPPEALKITGIIIENTSE